MTRLSTHSTVRPVQICRDDNGEHREAGGRAVQRAGCPLLDRERFQVHHGIAILRWDLELPLPGRPAWRSPSPQNADLPAPRPRPRASDPLEERPSLAAVLPPVRRKRLAAAPI
jgi:hypothetical protein